MVLADTPESKRAAVELRDHLYVQANLHAMEYAIPRALESLKSTREAINDALTKPVSLKQFSRRVDGACTGVGILDSQICDTGVRPDYTGLTFPEGTDKEVIRRLTLIRKNYERLHETDCAIGWLSTRLDEIPNSKEEKDVELSDDIRKKIPQLIDKMDEVIKILEGNERFSEPLFLLLDALRASGLVRREQPKGGLSDLYVDIKRFIGKPENRKCLAPALATLVPLDTEFIAARGYGGVPLATEVADLLDINLTLVRDAPSEHGGWSDGQLPGHGNKIVVIDDVLAHGGGLKTTIDAIISNNLYAGTAIVAFRRGPGEELKKIRVGWGPRVLALLRPHMVSEMAK
jgi:orotate phosphoribosyltransferase